MTARNVSVVVIAFLAASAGSAFAQQSLGDFVTGGGYDWIVGRWAADTDGGKVELEYKWALNKHVILADVKMGDYRQQGIVMLSPDQGEVIGIAADNKGNTWKGDWTDEAGALVYRLEQTGPDGQGNKLQVTHAKVDADTITVALYGVDSSGSRNSEPMGKLTYKRQPAAAAAGVAAVEQGGQSGDYQKLADRVAEGGYEWLAGKWLAADEDRKYSLEHKWVLDKHAMLVDLKTGDFEYLGMIMYLPARQEIIQVGADSTGGVWKGAWDQGYEGATHRVEYTGPDGATRKMEHVYLKSDNDEFKVKEYGVTDGTRGSEPRRTLTFKRQKPAAQDKP